MRSEIHPLDALLAKEKVISEEAPAVHYVSSEVVGMVEKDRAPIPEVMSTHVTKQYFQGLPHAVHVIIYDE